AVDMTREQAREFLLLSHISEHAVETLGPTPVWELAPPAVLAGKDPAAFNYRVVVNVDADGTVISIHDGEDEAKAFLDLVHEESALRSRPTADRNFDSLTSSVRIR